jgi:RNA polymerase sigma-70 factor (ECF subfamily)
MELVRPLEGDPSASPNEAMDQADEGATHLDFATVYDTHFAFVWRCLRRLGVPEGAVDDAHQEVFLVAHRRLDEFEGRSSLKTWLFGIILNVVRRHRRSARKQTAHEPLAEALVDTQHPSPLESAAKAEAARMLESFLASLDPDKRAVFILAELEQMTAQEVAAATSTNVRTVYSRLRVARQDFEQAVARYRARDRWRTHARAQ